MAKAIKKFALLALLLVAFPLSLIFLFGKMDHKFSFPEFLGPKTVVSAADGKIDTLYYTVPDFELIDHNGQAFGTKQLKGKTWLVAFYSTETTPYVAKITERLLSVRYRHRGSEEIHILCISTDPVDDTPDKLKDYINETRVNENYYGKELENDKWKFLTGPEADVKKVISEYFLTPDYEKTSSVWVLDEELHLRGKFSFNQEKAVTEANDALSQTVRYYSEKRYEEKKALEVKN